MFVIKEGTPADKIGEGTSSETLAAINSHLAKQGMTVRTKDQDESFVKASSQKYIDEAFGVRNAQLEKDILDMTGIAKTDSNEKYYDYFKRALKDHKTNVEQVNNLKAKIDELGKTGGNSKLIEDLRGELKSAQDLIMKNSEEYQKQINETKVQLLGVKIKTITDQAMEEIKPTLKQFDASVQNDVIHSRLAKFSSEIEATETEGMIVYKNKKDGSVLLSKTDGKPMSAKEVLSPYFEDIVDKGRKAGGAGSGKGDGKNGEAPAKWKEITLDKSVINTKMKLTDYLAKELKMPTDSKDFTDAFMELGKDLPLR